MIYVTISNAIYFTQIMQLGDFVKLEGTDIYGEILGADDTHVELYYLIRGKKCNGKIWTYSNEWYRIPKEKVTAHYSLAESGGILRCLKKMGFRAINESEFVLIAEEEHPDMIHVDLGFDDDDMNTSADEEDDDDDDFVATGDYTLFTRANASDNRFVLDTHFAVDSFRRWRPQSEQARNLKQFIDAIEIKYATPL